MDPIDRRVALGVAGLAGVAALARAARGGPLDPPSGPPSSTNKTLQQIYDRIAKGGEGAVAQAAVAVETLPGSPDAMYVISQPGRYVMTRNLVLDPNRDGVAIACDGVDFDGDGFHFVGAAGSPPRIAIKEQGVRRCVCIHDTGFLDWRGCCMDFGHSSTICVEDCVFVGCVTPTDPTGSGGQVTRFYYDACMYDVCFTQCIGTCVEMGNSCSLDDVAIRAAEAGAACRLGELCSVCDICITDSTCDGIVCGNSCSVDDFKIGGCTGTALRCLDGCCVECGEVTNHNGAAIDCGARACVEDVQVTGCTGFAVRCGDSSSVSECVMTLCGAQGCPFTVSTGHGSCVSECECRECTSGVCILCGDRCTVEECDTSNGSSAAIRCGNGACVRHCYCILHPDATCRVIETGNDSTLTDCDVAQCTAAHCLWTGSQCRVEECSCVNSAAAGIYCADGCCIVESEATLCSGLGIQCGARCTVECCRCCQCAGIDCGAECCVSSCELNACDGSGGGGGGGAINARGPCGTIEDNHCSNCPLGISVMASAPQTLVEDNHITNQGGGGGGGGIAILAPACLCICNSVRGVPGAIAYTIAQGSNYGPIADVAGTGDISQNTAARHPSCNFQYT